MFSIGMIRGTLTKLVYDDSPHDSYFGIMRYFWRTHRQLALLLGYQYIVSKGVARNNWSLLMNLYVYLTNTLEEIRKQFPLSVVNTMRCLLPKNNMIGDLIIKKTARLVSEIQVSL